MAEVVQRHLEDMLTEFEQAKRIGLFTEAEIKYVDTSPAEWLGIVRVRSKSSLRPIGKSFVRDDDTSTRSSDERKRRNAISTTSK